jgi:hypothetical protein
LIRDAFEEEDDGITVGGILIQSIRFADDQAVTADSNEGLQRLMDALSKSCKDYDMRINKKKTKVMRVCRGTDKSVNITVDGIQLEQVHQFQYLGSTLSEDAYCSQEIKRRIAMGKAAFNQRKELMCQGLTVVLKKRIMKVLVWSVVLYGSETWTIRQEDERRLEAFEMWTWRRMEKVKWQDMVTNEEVLRRVNEERSPVATIRKRQKQWIGHILRHDSLLRDLIEGRMKGKKYRGRPRIMMLDWLQHGNEYQAMKIKAMDRSLWRN